MAIGFRLTETGRTRRCFPRAASACSGVMPVLESTQDVPLMVSEDGTIRITGTRVSLDSVLHHYQQGATAEEIALRFPALRLADIYSFILAWPIISIIRKRLENTSATSDNWLTTCKGVFRPTRLSNRALP